MESHSVRPTSQMTQLGVPHHNTSQANQQSAYLPQKKEKLGMSTNFPLYSTNMQTLNFRSSELSFDKKALLVISNLLIRST